MSEALDRLPSHLKPVVLSIFATVNIAAVARLHTPAGQETSQRAAEAVPSSGGNVTIAVAVLLAVLVATASVLAALRLGLGRVFFAYVTLVGAWVVGALVTDLALPAALDPGLPVAVGLATAGLFVFYREWWVVNAIGIAIAIWAISVYGPAFTPITLVIALSLLAAYDHLAVEITGHMQGLGQSMAEMAVPVMLFIPYRRGVSLRDCDDVMDADVLLLGLGDVVIPSLLVVSAATHFTTAWPALATLAGVLLAAGRLLDDVAVGDAAAGLPVLNVGALAGLFVGWSLEYGIVTWGLPL